MDFTTHEGPYFAEALHLKNQALPVIIYTDGSPDARIIHYSTVIQDTGMLQWIRHVMALAVRYNQTFQLFINLKFKNVRG